MNFTSANLGLVFGRQLLFSSHRKSPLLLSGVRYLYTPAALGIDSYLVVRDRIHAQFSDMGTRFRSKMKDFIAPNSVNMVFTEDLKHMIHLAENTEEDLELVEEMVVKFNKQNKDLRFGSYIFGPVIMRMYHHLNRPKEALKVFLNPDLDTFFDQISSYQILMDLLFKNEMYDEVMQVTDIVQNKQISGAKFPRNVIVLAMAAAYKRNTPESLKYMTSLWAALQESGHEAMRRAITFAAALAINQNAPHIAMELLSDVPKQNYVTIRNLKVSALADINRVDDALPILRSVLDFEGPQEIKHTFCTEVLDKVKAAVAKSPDKEVQQEFQRILDQLTKLGHVTDVSLDSQLCTEIEKVILNPKPHRDQRFLMAKFESDRARRFEGGMDGFERKQRRFRPGLADMEE